MTLGTYYSTIRRPFETVSQSVSMRAPRERNISNLSFPGEDADYGMLLVFKEYRFRMSSQRGLLTAPSASTEITDTVFLPLPQNIADSFNIRVQRYEQGTGELVSAALSHVDVNDLRVANLARSLGRGITGILPRIDGNDLGEIAGNLSRDMAFLSRRGLDQVLPNQGRNIDLGTGTLVNPKATLIFDGIEMKNHSFDWVLAPKNKDESNTITQISNTIKRNMLPSYVDTAVIQRTLFKYPSTVDLFFIGVDPAHYFYFKTSMIQNFSMNYSSNGNAVLRDGRPASVQLQLSLLESDIHTAEDYGG